MKSRRHSSTRRSERASATSSCTCLACFAASEEPNELFLAMKVLGPMRFECDVMRETYPVPSVHGGGGLDRIAIELVQCSDGPERPVRAPKFLAKSDSGRALTDGRLHFKS